MSAKKFMRPMLRSMIDFFQPEPKNVVATSTALMVEREILQQELLSAVKIDGAPKNWDMEYFLMVLLLDGTICITETPAGILALRSGHYGMNVYERPTSCMISNPVFSTTLERTIGVDCALVHCRPWYNGYRFIIEYYASQMADCDGSIAVNLMNSRVAFVTEVQNRADREAAEKFYDMVSAGKPAVMTRTGTFSNMHYLNPKQSYIAADIYDLKNRLHSDYLSLLGISTVKTQKKERVLSAELERENEVNSYNIAHAVKTIQSGLDVANELYGLNLRCSQNILPQSEASNTEGNVNGNLMESD